MGKDGLYHDLKIFLVDYTGLDKDALHIHAALFLYLAAMLAFRQTRRSRFPWLFVLAVELGNEAIDLHREGWVAARLWEESAKDLWNTMLWPTILLLIGRYTTLFEHRTRTATPDSDPDAPPTKPSS
ncbi:hypothetical protein [Sphingosinicella rhizophila]|uniref:VanZ-like domain-containing protein n=1 Tax=Sphingosinicella rhizophila TaxID=3050082 RepID=A0ABU3Q671_9SPHN|nr:hypothetical protein [Sphingosinicella sp. GR2756]MDT9598908.1 hypothetical protein [Sphingosinicella sp. GR2756]